MPMGPGEQQRYNTMLQMNGWGAPPGVGPPPPLATRGPSPGQQREAERLQWEEERQLLRLRQEVEAQVAQPPHAIRAADLLQAATAAPTPVPAPAPARPAPARPAPAPAPHPTRQTTAPAAAPACLNAPGSWDHMISYTQRNAKAEVLAESLYATLRER